MFVNILEFALLGVPLAPCVDVNWSLLFPSLVEVYTLAYTAAMLIIFFSKRDVSSISSKNPGTVAVADILRYFGLYTRKVLYSFMCLCI
jgi:hypothetical protein